MQQKTKEHKRNDKLNLEKQVLSQVKKKQKRGPFSERVFHLL